MMMITQNLFFLTCWLSLFHFFQTCNANNSKCTPSSCGVIRNISFPFRLRDDPNNCGDRGYELACENDVALLYQNFKKFYVKEINYHNSSIRVVDASINNDDICSFPNYSVSGDLIDLSCYGYSFLASVINFMSCPNPLKNSSIFIDITHDCATSSNSSHPIPTRYNYVKVGHRITRFTHGMYPSDLPEMCTLEKVLMTSLEFKDLKNVSLSEIHLSLLFGFELEFWDRCLSPSSNSKWVEFRNFFISRLTSPLLIIPVIVVLFCAAVGPPVMAIVGFTAIVGLLTFIAQQLNYRINVDHSGGAGYDSFGVVQGHVSSKSSGYFSSIMLVCATRIIIYPFVLLLLIYKFRRRKLSGFDAIESFLQSDNKLVPIRYSYSQIKKMTRGFRDKLGEGGFGSVYKGKLRSGHHVAVKLLGKSGGNGQDFINEIATIGRTHHVNVVQLVGYCAQGTKRALVYDFMPNGSLEKYLFNRERMSSLNWETKFEIAVGVARGIEYLHRGCDIQILHFDIKPHNILLDDNFIPKVSDFGLAKFYSIEKNAVTMTAARGTIGYVAPELINRSIGAVSYKADVYSFGMLLMEMVGLNRELKGNNDDSSKYFPCWIYDRFNEGREFEIEKAEEINGNDENESSGKSVVRKMTIVGLWCIQMNPDNRPSMSKVLQMLEGDVERLQIPPYPSQSAHVAVNVEESWSTSASDTVSLLHNKNSSSIEITSA